ncbi:MAG: hypothetical protein ACREL9_02175 [Gemmatimonadales bacterium]
MRRTAQLLSMALAGTLVVGCQDLSVTNPNDPDRGDATAQPAAVEALISSGFSLWWGQTHQNTPTWALTTMADEFTGAFTDFGMWFSSQEPRVAWDNASTASFAATNREPWGGLHRLVSNLNDALRAIDGGVVIRDPATNADATPRARAVGKLMQGLAFGFLAQWYDSAFVVTEDVDVDTVTAPRLSHHRVVMDSAIAMLEAAKAIAQTNTFLIPGPPSWFRTPMTNTQLVQFANSWIARFLVSLPRTRAERDAVDWNRVLTMAEQGIQSDFRPVAEPDVFENGFAFRAARQRTTIPGDFARIDNWLVGPADSTQAAITWVNTPVANRNRFRLATSDKRIGIDTNPATRGLYIGFHQSNIWPVTRGTYHYTNYYFHRFGRGTTHEIGPQTAMTVAEMDFIRAEALIRLGRANEAVPLINKTRVANGQLPAVTIDGPPSATSCVPRKIYPGPMQGQCGSLWDALRYEKRIEMAGVDPSVAYADARGWQSLVENTGLHWPVPGRELETLQRALYTYGGPGGQSSSPAPAPERCPVALPRCP